jgi:hypothetical protein
VAALDNRRGLCVFCSTPKAESVIPTICDAVAADTVYTDRSKLMKTTIILMLTGALAGIAVASLAVPPALSWYSEPGGLPQGTTIQALVQIPEVIRYSTSKLIRWQMISAGLGAGVGLAVGIALVSKRPRAVHAPPPSV